MVIDPKFPEDLRRALGNTAEILRGFLGNPAMDSIVLALTGKTIEKTTVGELLTLFERIADRKTLPEKQ